MCRLIHCDSGKVRSGNYCRHRRELQAKYCPSFFVKMTIISVLQDITASKLNDSIGLIRKTIRVNILPIDITNVKLFVKSERASNDRPVDYFVAKFIIERNYVHGIYLSLILSNLHRKILTFYLNETYAFLCELAFFDEMIDGTGETYIKLQSYRQTSLDKLTSLGSKDYVELELCRETPIVQLHKTNLRPYIKLNIKELPMAFIDGTLILYGRHLTISLSKFEHKVQDDMVYICLEDYLLLYNAESGQTKQSSALLEQSRLSITLSLITVAFVYLFIPGFSSSSTSDKYR